MAKKKVVKKVAKKKVAKKAVSQEIVLRVENAAYYPTVQELAEPMTTSGKKLAIQKTWVAQNQIMQMVQKTPPQYVYERPGKGGQKFTYVSGSYVQKVLNFVFGWNWDFDIVEHGIESGFVWVKGKLTVRGINKDQEISKMQFGRAEIKYKKDSKIMLDFGNDLKAAATDAMKKCASMFGIAQDIYGKQEYKDESGNDPVPPKPPVAPANKAKADGAPFDENEVLLTCQGDCGALVEQNVADFSKKMYKGKVFCRNCQKLHKR